MNILALTSAYPQPDDGSEIVTPTVKYFCEKWVELGHQVIVIHNNSCFPAVFYYIPEVLKKKLASKLGHSFPTAQSRRKLVTTNRGVKCYRLPMEKYVPYTKYSVGKIRRQAELIERILNEEGFIPEIIVSHWVNPQLDIMLELRKKYSAKMSLVFHGDCTSKKIKQYNLQEYVARLDAVGCRNEAYAQHVKSELNLDRLPFICYSGIPDEQANYQMENIDNLILTDEHEFVFVGRLVKYKNVDVIIKALHKVFPQGDFVLNIVGTGAERSTLENLARELNIEKQVIFHGQLPRSEVFDLLKKSYCFIMVSDNETFGMVYIEAMLAGCITIASKGGGVDGVIINEENGFLSEQGSVDDLVKVLNQVNHMSEEDVRAIRKRAIKTADLYKDSSVAKQYLESVLSWKQA